MRAEDWDERYRAGRQWSTGPNRWVEQELSGAVPGAAIDVACGEGRNAIWLAEQGWRVVGVDFSSVALERAREAQSDAEKTAGPLQIEWLAADVTEQAPQGHFDLALVSYVQLEAYERTPLLRAAASALAPGGRLMVVAHDSTNLTEGHGGPQDPALLYTAADVAADLQDMISSGVLTVDRADRVAREVESEQGATVAWDALFVAQQRSSPVGGFSFGTH